METNEQYLKDFIFEREEIQKFNTECDSISEKANIIAKENLTKFEEISKVMEDHQNLMVTYNEKKNKLQELQRKIEDYKMKSHPRV